MIPTELEVFFSLTDLPLVRISIKVFTRLVQTSDTVECERGLKLDRDLSEVLGLQTIVTVLKVIVKVRVWNFGGQLEHR